MGKAIFLGLNALGDTLCTTPALHAFRRLHQETTIIYVVQSAPFCHVLDDNPDIDLLIYNEQLYFKGIPDQTADWIRTLPIDLTGGATLYRLDLKLACTTNEAFRQHISYRFAELLRVEIESPRPFVHLNALDRRAASVLVPRPYVLFSMTSVSNPEREDGRGRKKDWPLERWTELAARILEDGGFEVAVIGSERDARVAIPGVRMLYGLPIKVVAALLENAACVVTLESGIGHLAAAVDARTVEIYSNMMPPEWARPADLNRFRILYSDPFDTSVDQVFEAMQSVTAEHAGPYEYRFLQRHRRYWWRRTLGPEDDARPAETRALGIGDLSLAVTTLPGMSRSGTRRIRVQQRGGSART